jgi:hypothetical protein
MDAGLAFVFSVSVFALISKNDDDDECEEKVVVSCFTEGSILFVLKHSTVDIVLTVSLLLWLLVRKDISSMNGDRLDSSLYSAN